MRYAQPARGYYRTGIEPVLLAASIPAKPGDRVIEGGTGAGAGLLCLAARVPGLHAAGVERDAVMAAIAQANAACNPGPNGSTIEISAADLLDQPELGGAFDHAFANPPWHDACGTPSPNAAREGAKRAGAGSLVAWVGALAWRLRHHGSLTLVLPAGSAADALAALPGAGLGSPALLPFWPRAAQPAKMVLVRGVRGGRGACRVLPGLVLHGEDGRYTTEAEAVLRDGAALPF